MRLQLDLSEIGYLGFRVRDYATDVDDVRSVFSDVCEEIAERGGGRFSVSGFGEAEWPVDIRTDLVVVLEQIPEALDGLRHPPKVFHLDFYEQGLERFIQFSWAGCKLYGTCTSRTAWSPDPTSEEIDAQDLEMQLVAIRQHFWESLNRLIPVLATHKWILQWLGS